MRSVIQLHVCFHFWLLRYGLLEFPNDEIETHLRRVISCECLRKQEGVLRELATTWKNFGVGSGSRGRGITLNETCFEVAKFHGFLVSWFLGFFVSKFQSRRNHNCTSCFWKPIEPNVFG